MTQPTPTQRVTRATATYGSYTYVHTDVAYELATELEAAQKENDEWESSYLKLKYENQRLNNQLLTHSVAIGESCHNPLSVIDGIKQLRTQVAELTKDREGLDMRLNGKAFSVSIYNCQPGYEVSLRKAAVECLLKPKE